MFMIAAICDIQRRRFGRERGGQLTRCPGPVDPRRVALQRQLPKRIHLPTRQRAQLVAALAHVDEKAPVRHAMRRVIAQYVGHQRIQSGVKWLVAVQHLKKGRQRHGVIVAQHRLLEPILVAEFLVERWLGHLGPLADRVD